MRIQLGRGSHLPVLMKLLPMTDGPILELGGGYCSTPFLHWACHPTKRTVVTYENNPDYYDFVQRHQTQFHTVNCITDWDTIELSAPWSIAFVDQGPEEARVSTIKKLLHAEYVVVHDTQNRNRRRHGYPEVFRLFTSQYHYEADPPTSVLSNLHSFEGFSIP